MCSATGSRFACGFVAPRTLACLLAFLSFAAPAIAQSTEFKLGPKGWDVAREPEPGSDEAIIAQARRLIAKGEHRQARALLDDWIERNQFGASPWLPHAYQLRGDAKLALGKDDGALRDYEEVVKGFPQSDAFVTALEREFEIGQLYFAGLKRKIFGLRIDPGDSVAEEIMVRIGERLRRSRLAEKAVLALADYYYRERDLPMAVETYGAFIKLFPKSEHRARAMQRRIYANVARHKGPQHDATPLEDAQRQIDAFAREFPGEAERAGVSDALAARIDESLAAQMLETSRWYLKRDDQVSARFTLRRLVRKHPQTVAAARAVELLASKGWLAQPVSAVPATTDQPPRTEAQP